MQNFKPFFTFLLCVFCSGLLAACASGGGYGGYSTRTTPPPSAPPAQEAPSDLETLSRAQPQTMSQAQMDNLPAVKVGILLPLSGQHKALGDAMLKAAQMALFDLGHTKMELLPRDTQGTAQGAGSAAQSAINDGAQILLGPVFASSVQAAKPVAARARINMIAFSTDWSLAGGNTFIMGFLPFDQVQRLTQFATSKGVSRVGVLAPQSAYGNVVTSAFNRAATQNNIAVTQTATFQTNTNNLAPTVREFSRYDARQSAGALQSAPFDAVLMPVGGQDARAIGSLLTHYELPPRSVRRLGTGLFDETALASEANLDGAWFAAPAPGTRAKFEDRFLRTYGSRAPRLASLAFDATALTAVLAKRGLETTGRPSFDREAISSPNGFSGLDGIFRFRPDNTAERGLAILEFRGGQIITADPAPATFQNASQY